MNNMQIKKCLSRCESKQMIIKFTHVTAINILSIRNNPFYSLLHIMSATRLLI